MAEVTENSIIEEEDDFEAEAPSPEIYSIESYGLDFDLSGLARRFNTKQIQIPFYQRAEVWSNTMKSRLIESFLIGLPVPEIFLAKDPKTGRLDVIDGRQRLSAIGDFYKGAFHLVGQNIQTEFQGKKYDTLSEEDRLKLDNSLLHAVIVKQLSPEGTDGIIQIFKRLNEKPTPLTAQEIRTSVYHGGFCDLVDNFNKDKNWRVIWGKNDFHNRLKDQEMILRFLSLRYYFKKYTRPFSVFLDKFMEANKNFQLVSEVALTEMFSNAVSLVANTLGEKAFKEENKRGHWSFKVSIFDAAMVGISHGVENGYCTQANIKDLYAAYLQDKDFRTGVSEFTNDQDRIELRLSAAKRIFANIT